MKSAHIFYPLLLIAVTFTHSASAKLSPQKASKQKWYSASTSNFIVITDYGEKKAIKLAQNLERFRVMFELLANVKLDENIRPVKLYATKRSSTYNFLREQAGASKNTIGFFDDTINGNYAALKLDNTSKYQLSVLFHEYTHYLSANLSRANNPFWCNEGFAEYMGEMEFKDDKTILHGKPEFKHLANIANMSWMPLDTLLNTNHIDSKERKKRYKIYSQGWLLVHYFNSSETLIKQQKKFFSLISSGVKPNDAIDQISELSFSEFEKALKKYSRQRKFSYSHITLDNTLNVNDIKIHKLKADEIAYQLGEFALQTGGENTESRPYFEKALTINPNNVDAIAGLANTYLGNNDEKLAALISKAKKISPKNPWVATVSGHFNARKMRLEKNEALRKEYWNQSVRDFNTAINSGKINVEAICGASSLYAYEKRYKKALELLELAYAFAPSNYRVRTKLISLYLANKNPEEAQKIVDRVTNSHHWSDSAIGGFEKWYAKQIKWWTKYHNQQKSPSDAQAF